MPILKLHLENIGPFDKLELDLTDGNGKAHLGPHILAGVNGSGKSTVLKAIAWCLDDGESGFDREQWREFLEGRTDSRALVLPESLGSKRPEYPYRALSKSPDTRAVGQAAVDWSSRIVDGPVVAASRTTDPRTGITEVTSLATQAVRALGCIAAYAPSPGLRWLDQPAIGVDTSKVQDWLSFSKNADNESIQSYWVDCMSREALAKVQGSVSERAAAETVKTLKATVAAILGNDVEPIVNIEGRVRPAVRFRGTELNLSQLASGLNATLGWVVDYVRRLDAHRWVNEAQAKERPGVILIDEIETHLHPQWQRTILNGIRAAFPNTQIIVTTHSPFVVSSCPGARLHLFKLNDAGRSYLDESIDAPDSASLSANIMDVFGIRSEFSLSIEQKLDRWNDLKRRRSVGPLTAEEDSELRTLIAELSAKGEELSSIVAEPPVLPQSIIDELVSSVNKHR